MNNIVNVTHPVILRAAGQHQTETGLLWVPPKLRQWRMDVPGTLTQHTNMGGGRIMRFELHNRTAGAANVGIGFRWQDQYWKGGLLTAADVWTDNTTAYQAPTAVAVETAGAVQTGFCVMSTKPFSWVSVNFTTAETDNDAGAEITHTTQYSNAAGTGWTEVDALSVLTDNFTGAAGTEWGVAAANFVWEPPTDWGKSAALSATIPDGYYVLAFRVVGREANDVAAAVTGVEMGSMLTLEGLATLNVYANEDIAFDDPWADGLVAYFSVADAGNRVYAEVYAIG